MKTSRQLERELSASKAEVERLKELVNESIFEKSNLSIALVNCREARQKADGTLQIMEKFYKVAINRAENAEAEVDRLKKEHRKLSHDPYLWEPYCADFSEKIKPSL